LAQKISADFTHPRILLPVPNRLKKEMRGVEVKTNKKEKKQLWQSYP